MRKGTLSELPLYHLLIKPRTLAELQELLPVQKEHETDPGWLPAEARIYKPATFEYKGRKWPARIRFRGDNAIHWGGRKQSFRVKFPKNAPFNRQRRIDLINPKTANMIFEYLAMWLADRMDVLAPRIQLVNLKINHRLMGVYQETEHIDKYFLENHGKPAGNIYGEKDKIPIWYGWYPIYTDVVFWRKHCDNEKQAPDDYTEIERFLQILNEPSDEVFVEEIFNIVDKDKFYRWHCHSLLCSSKHQDWFHNARLYFDPTEGLFEFIPWDISGFQEPLEFRFDTIKVFMGGGRQTNPLVERVLQHPPYRLKRDRLLWSYVKDCSLLDEILDEADSKRAEIKEAVYNDKLKELIHPWPKRVPYSNEHFEKDFQHLKKVTRITFRRIHEALEFNDLMAEVQLLQPEEREVSPEAVVLARIGIVNSAPSTAVLKGINLPVKPEELGTIKPPVNLALFEDTNNNRRVDDADRAISSFEWDAGNGVFSCGGFEVLMYPDLNRDLQAVSTRRDFLVVRNDGQGTVPFDVGHAKIHAENAVTGEEIECSIQMVDEAAGGFDVPLPTSITEFRKLYPSLRCSIEDNKRIVLEPGEHRITETLVIPEPAVLEISEGTTLKFAPDCSLMCYGRLDARGTGGKPVRFTADDTQQGWGVIALCRPGANGSILEHCIIEYGGEARIHGCYFSGALSAYHATVAVSDSLFRKNRGDDAINCKYADGDTVRCIFTGNAADAIDYDYCEGVIADINIVDTGNDGIDCGTAAPLIIGNLISSCGDKGISVGEESRPLVLNNVVRDCTIGIALKDMSDPLIANNVLWNNKTGIGLYRKKAKYQAGGMARIMNTIVWGGKKPIEKDTVSEYRAEHCSIEKGAPGEGNREIRPEFVDPGKSNYILKKGSPLSAAGTDPGQGAQELLGLSGDTYPIGLAKPLSVPLGPAQLFPSIKKAAPAKAEH